MATVNIDLPPRIDMMTPAGQQAIISYMYRLSETLNNALNNLDGQNMSHNYQQQIDSLMNVSEKAQELAKLLDDGELAKTGNVRAMYESVRNSLLSQIDNVTASFDVIIETLDNQIRTYVEEHYIAADPGMTLDEKISSMIQQTADQIRLEFETLATIDVDSVNDLTVNFKTYIRFSEYGIEIGKQGDGASPIVTRITNERLEFAIAGTDVVVAYISNEKLHISMAEIDKLSIGNEVAGYVDFDMTADGLFIRWRS
ncbi:MAG: hypothetical protein ACOYU3_07325 [Bacillota bacterium]